MKKILVAIDFSDHSINALRVAVNLASVVEAEMVMLHVCKSCEDNTLNPPERTRNQKGELLEKLEELAGQCQELVPERLSYRIHQGRIYKVVVETAKTIGADLIVAGSHGISGFEEYFLGSNAFRIVTASTSPVLIVNNDFIKKGFRRILMPLDSSRDTRQKVPLTADLAKAYNAEVLVLGIYAYADSDIKHKVNIYCKQAMEHLQHKGVKNSVDFVESRKVAGTLLDYARKADADLVSIMSEIESDALSRLLSGDVQRIINRSTIPVLCVHAHDKFNYQISFTGITG